MRFLGTAVVALALAGPALGAPPTGGLVVPGLSLGGVRLGATQAQVRHAWGGSFGRCRSCRRTTWYFGYHRFEAPGTGVEFVDGRAVAIFTVWSPPAWHTPERLKIADGSSRITSIYGPLTSSPCLNYVALELPSKGSVTAFYVVDGRLWGFALLKPGRSPCLDG